MKKTPEEQIEIMYNIFAPFISNVWTDADINQIVESREQQLRTEQKLKQERE